MIRFIFYSKVNLNNIVKFIDYLKNCRAFKLTSIYLVICFVLLQTPDLLAEREVINVLYNFNDN